MNVKDVIISMSLAWDKEKKSESPTGFESMTSQTRPLYPLSYRGTRGEQGHILGSYLT